MKNTIWQFRSKSAIGMVTAQLLTLLAVNIYAINPPSPFENSNLPGSGSIICMTPVPGAPGSLLVGTMNGRIYKQDIAGGPWRNVLGRSPSPILSFQALADGTLLAASAVVNEITYNYYPGYGPFLGGGIYRSEDKGNTWTRVIDRGAMAFAERNSRIYAATWDGMLVSKDRGKSWTRVVSTIQDYNLTDGTRGLVWLGDTLCIIKWGEPSQLIKFRDAAIIGKIPVEIPRRTKLMYVAPWLYRFNFIDQYYDGSLKRSNDGGKTWQNLSPINFSIMTSDEEGIYGVTDSGIFSSRDGSSWKKVVENPPGKIGGEMAFLKINDTYYLGGIGYIGLNAYSEKTKSWSSNRLGLYDCPTFSLAFSGHKIYAMDTIQGILHKQDYTNESWKTAPGLGTGLSKSKLFKWKNYLIAPVLNGGSYLNDAEPSAEWKPAMLSGNQFLTGSQTWFAAYGNRTMKVCQESDFPNCRQSLMQGFPPPSRHHTLYTSWETNHLTHFAASGDTVIAALDSIWISADRGDHWSLLGPLPVSPKFLEANEGQFWIGGKDAIFRLLPGKTKWDPVGFEGRKGEIETLVFGPFGDAIVGTDKGVFNMNRHEIIWKDLSAGLIDKHIYSLAIFNNRLAVGLANGGVWVRDLDQEYRPILGIRTRRQTLAPKLRGKFDLGNGSWVQINGKRMVAPR